MPAKLVHSLQAMSDGECPVSECAFRDHARDPFLLARPGTALQVSGVGTQHPEHVRIIVHGSRPEMLGSREALASIALCRNYSKKFKYSSYTNSLRT